MLLEGIELSTSPLPRGCSTTELRQRPEATVRPRGIALAPRLVQAGAATRVDLSARCAILRPMDDKRTPSQRQAAPRPAAGKLAARQEREAAALRANLRKRKDQARAREQPKQE